MHWAAAVSVAVAVLGIVVVLGWLPKRSGPQAIEGEPYQRVRNEPATGIADEAPPTAPVRLVFHGTRLTVPPP